MSHQVVTILIILSQQLAIMKRTRGLAEATPLLGDLTSPSAKSRTLDALSHKTHDMLLSWYSGLTSPVYEIITSPAPVASVSEPSSSGDLGCSVMPLDGAVFISNTSLSLPCRSRSSNVKASDKLTARNVFGSLTLHGR